MIGVLGFKRVVVLLVLLVLNAALAGLVYAVVLPHIQTKEKDLRTVRSQVSNVQADIERTEIEIDQLESQQERFKVLEKDGFFRPQNRRQVQDLFKLIQKKSGVNSAVVSVDPAKIEKNKDAEKAAHKVLRSGLKVRIEAFDDVDVFHYLYLLENYFPGQISLENMTFEREGEITGTVLRSVAAGQNVPLVKADLQLVWRTMIPEAQVISDDEEARP